MPDKMILFRVVSTTSSGVMFSTLSVINSSGERSTPAHKSETVSLAQGGTIKEEATSANYLKQILHNVS